MKQQIGKEEFLKLWAASLPYNNISVLNKSTLHTIKETSFDENVEPFSKKNEIRITCSFSTLNFLILVPVRSRTVKFGQRSYKIITERGELIIHTFKDRTKEWIDDVE